MKERGRGLSIKLIKSPFAMLLAMVLGVLLGYLIKNWPFFLRLSGQSI